MLGEGSGELLGLLENLGPLFQMFFLNIFQPAWLPRLRRFIRLASPHLLVHLLRNVSAWPSGPRRRSLRKERKFDFGPGRLSFSFLKICGHWDRWTNPTCVLYIRMIIFDTRQIISQLD